MLLAMLWVAHATSLGFAGTSSRPAAPFLHARHAAVASDSRAASEAGVDALKAGGNAVDAACATALALGVVNPFASGLGGGGFALVYQAKAGIKPSRAIALDFRETAPAALAADPSEKTDIRPQSGLSVGVPGEARGLADLVRRYGKLPFSRCVEPALKLSRGFSVSPWLAQHIQDEITRNPDSGPKLIGKIFSIDQQAARRLRTGDQVGRPNLTATLERLAREGAEVLYQGELARSIVGEVRAAGGVLTLDDLTRYAPVDRLPLTTTFLGHRILVMPPPSAGGTIQIEVLGILANHATSLKREESPVSPGYLHLLVEALKHGFADRAHFLGDPAFTRVPLEHLLDVSYHRELAGRIRDDRVLGHRDYGTFDRPAGGPARDAGTAHISVVDKAGNAVALTTTINLEFGSRIVASGIVLNNEMDDFARTTGSPNIYGADVFSLSGSEANLPRPGKRPVSSMSPTIVLGDRGVEMVAGAAGGPRIVSATLQLMLDVLVFGHDARQAMTSPRIHHQWEPEILYFEPATPSETLRALENIGHRTRSRADIGKANLILRSTLGLDVAADPRSGGEPAGY